MPRRPSSSAFVVLRLILVVAAAQLLAACAAAPPPPPPAPPRPTGPVIPTEPIAKPDYVASWVDFEVEEVFVGSPMFRSTLHWLVAGKVHNRGNRVLRSVDVRFHFGETSYEETVTVLDVFQENDPVQPGETRRVTVPTARLEYGVVGPVDPAKVDTLKPPTVTVKVTDLTFME